MSSTKVVYLRSYNIGTQVFGFRLCASRLAVILCCLRTPCRRYVNSTTAGHYSTCRRGPLLVLVKETPPPGRDDDLQSRNLFSQRLLQVWVLPRSIRHASVSPEVLCLASVFCHSFAVPLCSRCFSDGQLSNPCCRISIGLTSFRLLFTSLGIVTFLDSGLLTIGNVSCVSCLPTPMSQ